jgi:hypothetical protein
LAIATLGPDWQNFLWQKKLELEAVQVRRDHPHAFDEDCLKRLGAGRW